MRCWRCSRTSARSSRGCGGARALVSSTSRLTRTPRGGASASRAGQRDRRGQRCRGILSMSIRPMSADGRRRMGTRPDLVPEPDGIAPNPAVSGHSPSAAKRERERRNYAEKRAGRPLEPPRFASRRSPVRSRHAPSEKALETRPFRFRGRRGRDERQAFRQAVSFRRPTKSGRTLRLR